jgi:hypothetical protein
MMLHDTNKQQDHIIKLLKSVVYILFSLWILNALSFFYPSPIFAVISLICFLTFIVCLSKFAPTTFILLLIFIFIRLTCLISGISIEYGAELVELQMMGYATGAMLRLAMVYIYFITVSAIVIEWFCYRFNTVFDRDYYSSQLQNKKWVSLFFAVVFMATIVAIVIGAKAGFPLITGMSRLAFREAVESKVFLLYISNRQIFILLLGVVYAVCIGYKRKVSLTLYILTIFVAILFGEKFTSLILLSVLMFTPALLLSKRLYDLNLTKLVVPIIILSLFTVPIILYVYGWNEDPILAIEKLTNRFAGQAQLWFIADSEMSSLFSFDLNSFVHNINSFISLNGFELANVAPYFGARYFMYNYMGDDLLFLFLETDALTLTMAFEPYLLMTNGWVGQLLPLTICAIAYAFNLAYLHFGIIKGDFISLFLSVKLLIWSSIAVQQGELYFMFGVKFLLFCLISFIYEKSMSRKYKMENYSVLVPGNNVYK